MVRMGVGQANFSLSLKIGLALSNKGFAHPNTSQILFYASKTTFVLLFHVTCGGPY